jgi:uncharacterized small protein (DUF1192 family)
MNYLTHYKKMRSSYKIKLDQLKTFGTHHSILGQINDTESSIKLLDSEIERLTAEKKIEKIKLKNEKNEI